MAQIVVLKRAHFFSIDNDIIKIHGKVIGALGVAIYTALACYANRKTGECWPAIGRLARDLDLARSTVKVYLRKLEAVGLITITERRDTAGDPTSNRYTLLDPSPAAVDKRLVARVAARAEEDVPSPLAPEGGRPPADPPPAACRPTGGPSADPKPPSSLEHKEENQAECSRLEENPQTPLGTDLHHTYDEGSQPRTETRPKTPPENPCPHPLEERSYFGDIAVCHHCWGMLDLHANTTPGGSELGEESQAHAACAA
jgi:DNA-binding MarR family transcriptional regulator